MPKCIIEKLNTEANEQDLQAQFDFCKMLTEPSTNGFGWPVPLMEAQDLKEFRLRLGAFAAKENYNLEALREHGYVPQQYWWVKNEQNAVIGLAKLRYILTPAMLRRGGHIGYGLAEAYRGQGYGTAALALLLGECRKHGLHDVLLTADPDNFASRRVIEKNGGQLWDIVHREEGDAARYWIHVE